MASNYKIKLGVHLVTKGLRAELNKIGEKPIKVKVDLSTRGLRTQLNEIGKKPVKAKVQFSTRGLNTQIAKDIKPVKIKLDTSHVEKQINNLKNKIKSLEKVKINLGNPSVASSKGSKGAVNEMNWAYKQMLDIQKKANSLSLKINGLDTKNNVNELKELSLQFARLKGDYETLKKAFGGKLSTTQLGNLQAEITETESKLSAMDAKIADTRAKLAKEIKINFQNGKFSAEVQKVKTDAGKLSNVSNELQKEIRQLEAAMKLTGNGINTGNVERIIKSYEKYKATLKSVENQLKRNKSAQQAATFEQGLKDDRSLFQQNIDAWLKTNSAAAAKFGKRMLDLRRAAESCDNVTLEHLKKEFKKVDKEAEAAGKKMQKFGDRVKAQFSKYSSYLSASSVFMYGSMALRDMFEQVVAIDKAMTELKKVTDETDASYSNFLKNASSRASEIGTTIDGLVTSTAGFARLGYGFEESQGMAEIANIYAVVGDEVDGVDGATKSLISTMAAFYEEASGLSKIEFAEDTIDKFNEIGNNFAISSGGIGEALQRSASSLFAANNTLDESIALITAANTVVQDPDVVGTALKTVSMRIRGAKTEMEEAGIETDGMAESTAKLRAEMLALSGVDIMLDKNTFKSTYQIMEELAEKWESMTDIQQASVTELIAGKRQGNIISSLMTNFDVAQDALETSLNSEGSALKEHEKWLQSLEAKINQIKAAWQGLAQAFMSSDFLKVVLDGVINLLEGLTKLIDKIGVLPALFVGFTAFKGITGILKVFATARMVGGISKFSDILTVISLAFPKAAAGATSLTGALTGMGGASAVASGALKGLMGAIAAHPIIAAAVIAVTALTAAFMYQQKKAKELAEEVENTVSAYQEQHNELMNMKKDFDVEDDSSMASRYEKLSKGVDNLGRNVSLTTDEYIEYQSIVNSIAESIPSLVAGYDEQGNAILNCKGNVEELTAAYEELIHVQNREILTNAGKIEEDFSNKIDSASGEGLWSNNHGFWSGLINEVLLLPLAPTGTYFEELDYDLKSDTVKGIQDMMNAADDEAKKEAIKELKKDKYSVAEIQDALEAAGEEIGAFENPVDALLDLWESDPQKVKGIVDEFYAQFDSEVAKQKSIGEALLSEAFDVGSDISGVDYSNISENLQDVAKQVVGSFDWDFLTQLEEEGRSVEEFVNTMLADFNELSEGDAAKIETAFEFQTEFNGGDITYGEYVKNLSEIESLIDGLDLDEEVKEQLKVSLDIDEDGIIKEYDSLLNRLTDTENYDFNITEKQATELLDGLSAEEVPVAIDVIAELSDNDVNETVDEVEDAINKELALRGMSLDFSIDTEATNLESLSTALAESASGAGLTSQSLSAIEGTYRSLESYDPSKLFERTANGMRLNTNELSRLDNEYKKTNLRDANKQLNSLADAYNQTREELYNLTYGTKAYDNKLAELNNIEARINETEQLITQYEGLTSAYQEWQRAEQAGNQRDMYENVITGFQTVEDELSRGWADDSTVEFLELITGQTNLAGMSGKELKEVYDGLGESIKLLNEEGKVLEDTGYSVRDFFTVDDEGNSTSRGVYNFLDAVSKLEEAAFGGLDVVQKDADGNIIGFDFDVAGGDEAIAETLGISEELVQIMVRAADDAGFVISMDGTYQQLDVLKEKAQLAAETLNGILEGSGKKGFDFDFNSTDIDDITNQLTNAKSILDGFRNEDGTINMGLEGAEEALTVTSTLQSMLDNLSRPTYMDIQTSQVEEELQEPLEKLQEIRLLTEQENQLKLTGADTSELTKSKEEIYEYFEGLDPDIKAEVGLVDDKGNPLSGQALKDKIDSGAVNIPATVDIQMEMDDKLGILVDKALLDAGIIDEKEFEKRVAVYFEGEVDSSDVENKVDEATNNIVKPKGVMTPNGESSGNKIDKTVDVEITADEVDTSDVDNKTNNAIAKPRGVVANGKDGHLEYGIGVDVEADVDTTGAEEEIEEAENKVVQDAENGEELIVEKEADVNISEVTTDVDSLIKYIEAAESLSEIADDIEKTITANIEGNVFENTEKAIDNLGVFVESAQGINDIPDEAVKTITADIKGNVFENTEKAIDNLGVFVESAQGINDIPDMANKTITANIEGNVFENTERAIDNLGVFVESATGINDIPDMANKTITANIEGSVFTNTERAIDNLGVFVESAQGIDAIPNMVNKTITANIEGSVFTNTERAIDNLGVFVESAQGINDIPDSLNKSITANIDGSVFTNTERAIDNLGVFVESAQGIDNLNDNINKSVTANINGNVFTNTERAIDNLGVFVESAQGIDNLNDNINKSITANIDGSVFTNTERAIDNLGVFVEGAQGIDAIQDNINKTITANIDGSVFTNTERAIDNLGVFVESAQGIDAIQDNINKTITANVNGNVFSSAESSIDNLSIFAKNASEIQNLESSKDVSITANANGNVVSGADASSKLTSLRDFKSIASSLTSQEVTITVTANVDVENIEAAIDELTKVANSGLFKDYSANVSVNANTNLGSGFTGSGTVTVSPNTLDLGSGFVGVGTITPKPEFTDFGNIFTGTAKITPSLTQTHFTVTVSKEESPAAGTAHTGGSAFSGGSASGRAFARGDWGIKGSGIALGGELGQEIVVRDGKFFTIGDEGAEFFHYKKNDIVFNATQTEALFKYGGIKGANPRGKMLASGSAFAQGKAFSDGQGGGFWGNPSGGSGGGSGNKNSSTGRTYGNSSSNSSDSAEKFQETLDWIEIAIDRIERAIDQLDTKANSVYRSWTERNESLADQIGKVGEEIELQNKAYDEYIQAANDVGLDEAYAEKVRNGLIDIETITDETLKEKIDDYKQWYEKALDCKDAILELKEAEAELLAQRFENVQSQYENILQQFDHTEAMLEEYISQTETKGQIASKNYYQALIDNENARLEQLRKEQSDLIKERDEYLQDMIARGYTEEDIKNSEKWYELCEEIDSTTQAIEEGTTALLEYDNAMREIDWSIFDLIQERIADVSEEADFLIELMSNKKLFDDNGKFTEQGTATVGLHTQKYNAYMYQSDEYGKEIAELDKQIANDPYDQELINRRNELIDLQRESILAAENEKNAIRDLVEEGINLELDALQERIDKQNELLDSQKDLYDYQKKVKEQTQEIADIEKQMSAYQGDDSEEARAKLQELKVSLDEAQQELEETEYDKFIDDSSAMLDSLYNEYELILNQRLDNIDALISQVIDGINGNLGSDSAIAAAIGSNASTINETLSSEAKNVGVELSDAMNKIWSVGEGNAKSILTMYGEGFQNKLTTTNNVLNSIKSSVNSMVSYLDKEAKSKVNANKTSSSVNKNPVEKQAKYASMIVSQPKKSKITDAVGGDGKAKIGDRVKFVSGLYYYDAEGKKPLGEKNKGKYVYITNINTNSWATHKYHISTGNKLGKGDLGWLKLSQLSGYATGKKNFFDDEVAWTQENGKEFIVRPSDGAILTPIAKGDSVLTSVASNNIWDMANSPAEFIRDNLNLGTANMPNSSNSNNSYTQHLENVVFSFPQVKNYEQMLHAMKDDKNFERLIQSMTVDQIAGKSSLAKGKSIR